MTSNEGIARSLACLAALALATACGSSETALRHGEVISNDLMLDMYPNSFRPGEPPYLERDFEAGADFICDEIELHYERDICADPEIKWRR